MRNDFSLTNFHIEVEEKGRPHVFGFAGTKEEKNVWWRSSKRFQASRKSKPR